MTLRNLTLLAALAVSAPGLTAATVSGTTSDIFLDLNVGELLRFGPLGSPNLTVEGPFETAVIGTPFAAQLNLLALESDALLLKTGTYLIDLEQTTPTPGTVTLLNSNTFESRFTTSLTISFQHIGPGSEDNTGDIQGEYGELLPVETTLVVQGAYTSGPGGFEISDITLTQPIPEPSSMLLLASATAALVMLKRKSLRRR
jgi:hypothetical protein